MAKAKKNQFNTVTTFSKTLAMILFIVFPVLGFYLGTKYEEINSLVSDKQEVSYSVEKPLSQPARLVEEFYSQYVSCLDKNYGSTKTISGDCDSLITTKYFTQEAIDLMSGRSMAYCGYEPPSGIYVTEGKHEENMASVVLWGKFASEQPTIIQLKQGVINGKVYQDWQIDKIVCL